MITDIAPATADQSTLDSTMVVAYDGSSGGRAALIWALAEGVRRRRPLRLVHVLDPARPQRNDRIEVEVGLNRVAAEANHWGRAGMDITAAVHEGAPAAVLRALSETGATIVVGDQGTGGQPGIGSVADRAPCSVMIVR